MSSLPCPPDDVLIGPDGGQRLNRSQLVGSVIVIDVSAPTRSMQLHLKDDDDHAKSAVDQTDE
jgi:hypothetical protein